MVGPKWDPERVGSPIGLDLVLAASSQLGGRGKVDHRQVQLPGGDVAVSAMASQAVGLGEQLESSAEYIDRLSIPAQVGEPAPEPDDRLLAVRICRVGGLGGSEVLFEPRARAVG